MPYFPFIVTDNLYEKDSEEKKKTDYNLASLEFEFAFLSHAWQEWSPEWSREDCVFMNLLLK